MAILDDTNTYATLINTFEVEPEKAERLLQVLHEATGTIRKMPGFISANLHVSTDKTRVVNYAQWRTHEDFLAMLGDPEAQPHMKEAAALATSYDPVFYTLRHAHEA